MRQGQQGLPHFIQAEGAQLGDAEKIQKRIVVLAVGLQALVAAAHPQQPWLALQYLPQHPLRLGADVVQQQVGVVHQQQQALVLRLADVPQGLQRGFGLFGGRQGGQAGGGGIDGGNGFSGLAVALQRIGQAVEHIGPELRQGVHRVLLFRKSQWQPDGAEAGIVFHGQGQALHQGGFAHAPCAHQQAVLAHGACGQIA